jgi:hypothetical protein
MPDEALAESYVDAQGRTHRVTVEQERRSWVIYDDDGISKTPLDTVLNSPDGRQLAEGLASEYAKHRDRSDTRTVA